MQYVTTKITRRRPISSGMGSFAVAAAAASTLKTGLIAYWELEEASGSRADSHTNGLTLTENGTVSQVAGKVGNAASFPSAGNILRRADDALFNFSGGITVACWLRFPTAIPTTTVTQVSKLRSFSEWILLFEGAGSDKLIWQIFNSVTNPSIKTDTFGASFVGDTWYFICCTADNTNIKISVDNGTKDSAAQGNAIDNTTEDFRLGDQDFNGAFHLDQVGLWSRALTDDEITQLYNGGSGRSYAAL
jgi:Concanavalin A-like lectin/glucanases superfamily